MHRCLLRSFFPQNSIEYPIMQSAFICLTFLLDIFDICTSKFSLLSNYRSNNVRFSKELMTFSSSIVSFGGSFFLSLIIAWIFSQLKLTELCLNHCVAVFPSFSNSEIGSFNEPVSLCCCVSFNEPEMQKTVKKSIDVFYLYPCYIFKFYHGTLVKTCDTTGKVFWVAG